MSIWDRLGTVLKSYLNDDDRETFSKSAWRKHGDPDVDAAYEELDDFLKGGDGKG